MLGNSRPVKVLKTNEVRESICSPWIISCRPWKYCCYFGRLCKHYGPGIQYKLM